MMIVFTVLAVFGQGSYSEPIGVAVVLLAIAFIGMNTGLKSQKSAKELKDRTSIHYCNVIRDGKVEHINSNDLVVGDLVIIQSGEAIYADGYLVEGNVKVDNSVLNGESDPCKKTPWENEDSSPIIIGGKRHANSNDYVDSYSLFAGTTVTDGEGKMVVTNVGVNTVNGQTISTIDEIEEMDKAIVSVKYALDYSKTILVTPMDLDSKYKENNKLIKEGADVLASIDDLVDN